MRNDFCAFILTHGRPDRVYTLNALEDCGYTGKIFIVIDDEDKTGDEYRKLYKDRVLTFSKSEIVKTFDEGDNFQDRRAIIYARNACFELAKQVGVKYFIQLDDDYTRFDYRFDDQGFYNQKRIRSLDKVWSWMVDYLAATPFKSVAMAQGGDFIGGAKGTYAETIGTKRKAMNSFICDVDRPFKFVGRINEDVNTYTGNQRRDEPFLTFLAVSLNQKTTQANSGGMTELYLDAGTYIKSFYSVMYCPSAVKITPMGETHKRLHHQVSWNHAAPKIIRAEHKKLSRRISNAKA